MNTTRVSLAALLAAVALVASSCREPSPLGVHARAPTSNASLIGPLVQSTELLRCSPFPSDSVTQTVGPEGGFLTVGPHTLTVPPGALAEPVSITAVAPSDTVNRVRLEPEGLSFQRPVFLAMSYANCDLLGTLLPTRIVYTTDALEILSYVPSLNDLSAFEVSGLLRHFSTYAIAW